MRSPNPSADGWGPRIKLKYIMTVFYRKYRPQKLADVIDQEHVKKTLLGQLESGRISHGYLFAGPKGTGKTSTARIFAKAVNCKVYSSQPALPAGRSTVHSKEKSGSRAINVPCVWLLLMDLLLILSKLTLPQTGTLMISGTCAKKLNSRPFQQDLKFTLSMRFTCLPVRLLMHF